MRHHDTGSQQSTEGYYGEDFVDIQQLFHDADASTSDVFYILIPCPLNMFPEWI